MDDSPYISPQANLTPIPSGETSSAPEQYISQQERQYDVSDIRTTSASAEKTQGTSAN